jgi:hypothetical protein
LKGIAGEFDAIGVVAVDADDVCSPKNLVSLGVRNSKSNVKDINSIGINNRNKVAIRFIVNV